MWNDKSLRLRYLRDRLHITGQHAPTFIQSIDIIIEVLGLIHSGRNLSWCRRETTKLRERYPEMTRDQLERIAVLDDKLQKKAAMIRDRRAKKEKKHKSATPTAPAAPAPATGQRDVWDA